MQVYTFNWKSILSIAIPPAIKYRGCNTGRWQNATCNNHGDRITIGNYKQPLGCYCVEPDIAHAHYVPESSLKCIKWLWFLSAPIYRGSGDSYAWDDTDNDPSRLASLQAPTPQIPTDRSLTFLKQSLSRHTAESAKLSRSCTAGTREGKLVQSPP